MLLDFAGQRVILAPNPEEMDILMDRVSRLYSIAQSLDFSDYLVLIRSCRLFQLAKNTNKLDHNLAYSLLISSIEANSDKAIKVKDLKENWSVVKKKIIEVAKSAELEQEFTNVLYDKLDNHYAGIRFRKFIIENLSFKQVGIETRYKRSGLMKEEIEALEPCDRRRDSINYFIDDYKNLSNFLDILKKFQDINFENLLKNSYSYRSKFYHAGEASKYNKSNQDDRYIKKIPFIVEKPFVVKEDFDDINFESDQILKNLKDDGFIRQNKSRYYFDIENILKISNSFCSNQGLEIRQVFYQKKTIFLDILTFNFLAQIASLTTMEFYGNRILKDDN